jgi:hypothetical protein
LPAQPWLLCWIFVIRCPIFFFMKHGTIDAHKYIHPPL